MGDPPSRVSILLRERVDMASISVLPDDLVNQIAAGEVVERPASVVKELVENALDAGATRVDVAIEDGGITRVSVTDDGCGLSRRDAALAFERHATSKIASIDDLARVETLGFRGEALPSIASVARVRMRTRRPADRTGVELVGEGRGIERISDAAGPSGTRIEVAELFAQVPARRKFLKSATTEAGHVVRWLERIALARPDLRLSLERDGRPSLAFLPTKDLKERVVAVLPPSLGEHLVPVREERGQARIVGFATRTDVRRGSAADIHLYVNGRPVRDRLLLSAVREAYRDALPPGRHPAVVLFLFVDPGDLDVNVHPAKWEVRFRDPGAVRTFVRRALTGALGPAAHVPSGGAYTPSAAGAWSGSGARFAQDPHPPLLDPGVPPEGDWLLARDAGFAERDMAPSRDRASPPASFARLRYLGQALGAYLVLEGEGALVLMDQHAAHERVLFERMRCALLDGKIERQALLLPEWMELPASAAHSLAAHGESLARSGFELEIGDTGARGGVRVGVREVPALLAERRNGWRAMLEETAALLGDSVDHEARDGLDAALHDTLATAACHAARRKGDRLDPREVHGLLEALDETIWFPNCPHGRPILSVVSEGELERRFLRR